MIALMFTRTERLRECRAHRDNIIRDNMYNRMSPLLTRPSSGQLEDAGYRSDDSNGSQTYSLAKQHLSAFNPTNGEPGHNFPNSYIYSVAWNTLEEYCFCRI